MPEAIGCKGLKKHLVGNGFICRILDTFPRLGSLINNLTKYVFFAILSAIHYWYPFCKFSMLKKIN